MSKQKKNVLFWNYPKFKSAVVKKCVIVKFIPAWSPRRLPSPGPFSIHILDPYIHMLSTSNQLFNINWSALENMVLFPGSTHGCKMSSTLPSSLSQLWYFGFSLLIMQAWKKMSDSNWHFDSAITAAQYYGWIDQHVKAAATVIYFTSVCQFLEPHWTLRGLSSIHHKSTS